MIDPGLCLKCEFAQNVRSDRGSTFTLCRRGLTDRSFPKYPRLPVRECRGYAALSSPDDSAKNRT